MQKTVINVVFNSSIHFEVSTLTVGLKPVTEFVPILSLLFKVLVKSK